MNRSTSTQRRILAGAAAFALAFTLAACDEESTGPAGGEEILFEQGVNLQLTDTAVVVNGTSRARVNDSNRAFTIYHTASYEYGGFGGYTPDRIWGEQWFSRLLYDLEPEARGDTVVLDFLDFGDVTLAGMDTLGKGTEIDVSNAPYPITVDNFVIYFGTHYVWQKSLSGAETLFVESPYLTRMLRGDALDLSATGSDRASGFQASFSIEPLPAVVGLNNNGGLDFKNERPVIDADHDLVISFDGMVDADRTIFALVPWHEDVPAGVERRDGVVVGQLQSATDRATVPASVLTDLLDGLGIDSAGYMLYIIRYSDVDTVIDATRLDTDAAIQLMVNQADQTFFMVRLTR